MTDAPRTVEALLDLARTAALAGGQAILPYVGASVETEAKTDGSPVTAADLAADRAIAEVLAESGFPILSEESAFARAESLYTWVVDPLDGTKAFVAGRDEFTVNVALVESHPRARSGSGFPILGVVLAPASGVTYGGSAAGAWREAPGEPRRAIRVRDLAPDRLMILTSRSYRGPAVERLVASAQADGYGVETRALSSSLKMCLVAEGAADLYPRPGPTNAWDTAAAQAVLEAAGGFLGTWDGKRLGVSLESPLNPPFVAMGGASVAEAWARWARR